MNKLIATLVLVLISATVYLSKEDQKPALSLQEKFDELSDAALFVDNSPWARLQRVVPIIPEAIEGVKVAGMMLTNAMGITEYWRDETDIQKEDDWGDTYSLPLSPGLIDHIQVHQAQ